MRNIINYLLVLIIFTIPYYAIGSLNISFIHTQTDSSIIVAEEVSTGTLRLQKKTLNNGSYTDGESLDIPNVSSTNLDKVLLFPISLSNNQITDKMIAIHTGSTSSEGFSAYIFNTDFSTSNLQTIVSSSNQNIETSPIIIKNSDGYFLVLALKGSSNDILRVYKLNMNDNSSSQVGTDSTYTDIESLITIDENMLAVVTQEPKAYIYSLPKQQDIIEYNLNTTSNVRIDYDSSSFKTSLKSDSDDNNEITNELTPYGLLKIY